MGEETINIDDSRFESIPLISMSPRDEIEEALRILDERNWTNVEEFLNPWGAQRVSLAHLAAYRGNVEMLKRATDLEATDKLGRCALHYAADRGHVEVVKWLLEGSNAEGGPSSGEYSAHPQLSLEDSNGMTALHLAKEGRRASVVRVLARAHIEEAVNIPDESKYMNATKFRTSWNVKQIHLDAYCGRVRISKSATANFSVMDKLGRSALHYAAERGQMDVIKYSMQPLMDISTGEKTLQFMTFIQELKRLPEVFVRDSLGMTVLHYAAEQGHAEAVAWLLKLRVVTEISTLTSCQLAHQDSDGMTALDLAMKARHIDVTKILVRAYFEHAVRIPVGESEESVELFLESWNVQPIHLVAYSGDLGLFGDTSLDLDAKDKFGRRALHYAADQGHMDVIKYLLEQFTSVPGEESEGKLSKMLLAEDSGGRCALHYAAEQGHVDIVNLLLEQPTEPKFPWKCKEFLTRDCLSYASYSEAKLVMNHSTDVPRQSGEEKLSQLSARDFDGMTALHLAVRARQVEVVKILVIAGANVDTPNKRGLPPILLAHRDFDRIISDRKQISQYEDITGMLLRVGASVESFDSNEGRTLLHYAVLLNSQKATQELAECEPSLILRGCSKAEDTPLHLAAARGLDKLLDDMLKNVLSSPIDIPNKEGLSPLHVAAIEGNFDCARLLIDKGGNLAEKDESGETAISFLCRHKKSEKLGAFFVGILDANVRLSERSIPKLEVKQIDEIHLNFEVLAPEGKGEREGEDGDEDDNKSEGVPQMAVVAALLETLPRKDQVLILKHPLLKAYNAMKWSHVRFVFYGLTIFQFIFAMSISIYTIYMRMDIVASIFRWMLLFFAGSLLICSLLQIFAGAKCYFRRIANWPHLFSLIMSITVGVGGEIIADPMTSWIPYFVSAAIPLIWIQTMLSAGQFAGWRFYALIFPAVLKDFLEVFIIGLMIIIGFAISFMALFRDNDAFDGFWTAVLKSVVMMTGEYEYSSLFSNDANDETKETYLPIISRIVFFIFVILTGIILMNLMIGLAVSDIHGLRNEGQFGWRLKQAEFIIDCERMANSRILQWCHLHKYLESNIHPTRMTFTRRDRPSGLPMDLVDDLFNLASKNKNRQKDSPVAIESSLAAMQSSQSATQSSLTAMEASLTAIQSSLQKIVDEQKLQENQIQELTRTCKTARQLLGGRPLE